MKNETTATIILSVIFLLIIIQSGLATNSSQLYGWTGSQWIAINTTSTGKLQTNLNLTRSFTITPITDNSFDLGSLTSGWANLFLARNAYLSTASGSVGVGTTNPTSTLTVSGNISVASSYNNSLGPLFIDATHNKVGIGNTTPSEALEVAGNIKVAGNVYPNAAPTAGTSSQTTTTFTFDGTAMDKIVVGQDGFPILAFDDPGASKVTVIKCGNSACSSGNNITALDTSGNGGASIAIPGDGLPIVSYQTSTTLKVVKCGTTSCNQTSLNTITTVDSNAFGMGSDNSITIGSDGLPVIAYLDDGNSKLKVAKCGNSYCNSSNTLTSEAWSGGYISITIGTDGLPIVSYFNSTTADLFVLKCGNIYCNASNINTTVDSVGDVGRYSDIRIGQDGLPVVSYRNQDLGTLKVVKCGNTACSSGNTITTVSNTGGASTSIAIPPDGLPVISHWNGLSGLLVTKCGNSNCTSEGALTTVDSSSASIGGSSVIVIPPDNLPIIAYRDATNAHLKIVKCALASCNQTSGGSYSAGSNLGNITLFWNNIYGANYWGKKFQIASFDVAEQYASSEKLEAGDVVRIDPIGGTNVLKTDEPYQTTVIGIVSTDPAITLGNWTTESQAYPIALTGRVPTKVTNENGPIKQDDYLTSSSKPGYAMKCPIDTPEEKLKCFGATIGKALEPCDATECKVLVLVNK